MKKHFLILVLIIFSFSNSFGQSKKKQIEQLNYRVDSLVRILDSERSNIKQQKTALEQLPTNPSFEYLIGRQFPRGLSARHIYLFGNQYAVLAKKDDISAIYVTCRE